MPPPVRPTLRSLREDLADTVTDPNVRRAVAEGKPPKIAIPLHAIEHPLLQSINRRVQTAPYEHRQVPDLHPAGAGRTRPPPDP